MRKTKSEFLSVKDKPIETIPLNQLNLDISNPRFASHVTTRSTQRDILNIVVRQFGVDDVLSSISVSGYFSAEPLVCRQEEDGCYTVIEGNRRLAACLILAGNERAVDHQKRHEKYHRIYQEHGAPAFDPVPSIIFQPHESSKMLMSYLGVRHIVSTKEWDSYAKAAWVSNAIQTSGLSLEDIAEMIGDNRGTVRRLLQGYNYIGQLEREELFNPETSVKKGRGSNTHYPFSWVYTILDSQAVRKYTGLSDTPGDTNPIPEDKLEDTALVVHSMFGNTSRSENPAIKDSRQIHDLAKIFANPEKVAYLRQGKSVDDIERITQPLSKLLSTSLVQILSLMREVSGRLDEDELDPETALQLSKTSYIIAKQATSIHQKVTQAVTHSDDQGME